MNLGDVSTRLAQIAANQNDPEVAHGAEDALYRDVLAAIAEGAPNARELAAEAIKADRLEFTRWYA